MWEEEYVAISDEVLKSGILDAPELGEIKDTEAMITPDGEVIEVKSDSTKTATDV